MGKKSQQHYPKRIWQEPCRIKSYNGKINTLFYNKVPKESPEYISLSVILLDTVYKNYKNYYPEVPKRKKSLLKNLLLTTWFWSRKFWSRILTNFIFFIFIFFFFNFFFFFLRKYKFSRGISDIFFRVFVSWSIMNFLGMDLFYFSNFGWNMQGSVSGKIRNGFFSENMKKAFFWENIRIHIWAKKF